MSDHTDGLEVVVASKKRMLEGHTSRGAQGKHGQHEERGVKLANASGVATGLAPHPSAAKKSHPVLCEHQRRMSQCKHCGGSGLCEHQQVQSACRDCGGSSFCEHQQQRNFCKACDSSSIFQHQRVRSICRDCGSGGICKQQRQRSRCRDCDRGCK